jgi:hypothetical protein
VLNVKKTRFPYKENTVETSEKTIVSWASDLEQRKVIQESDGEETGIVVPVISQVRSTQALSSGVSLCTFYVV